MILKAAKFLLICIGISFFMFPVSFYFLPEAVNTKMILAGLGILAFFYDNIVKKTLTIPRNLLYSIILALVFSLWCFYSVTANATNDLSYANYWVSFFTWSFGAYAIFFIIKQLDGSYTLSRLTFYLASVCLMQCILAEVIDYNPGVQRLVDSIFKQGQEFYHEVDRLYGIGAALDPAGVRFSVVLVLMAHQMSNVGKVVERLPLALFYFVSFIAIVIIGSIIARTTWVGAGMGLVYMIASYLRLNRGYMSGKQLKFWGFFLGLTLLTVVISAILYRISPEFRSSLRFGFEGFFNWAEKGVFRTDSTDKLNNTMWVWPTDTRGWTIGYGLFDNWVFNTDIGFCRFILYSGIIGISLFSLFFIYNGLSLYGRFSDMSLLPLFLIAMTFIIWLKVATDIFFVYALLYFIEQPCTSSTT
ncbi:MAG: hypothetical protein J6X71_04630 [Bacteroidales bacterium]|nr:hypothetical protein [Bacteroidales bacterium]